MICPKIKIGNKFQADIPHDLRDKVKSVYYNPGTDDYTVELTEEAKIGQLQQELRAEFEQKLESRVNEIADILERHNRKEIATEIRNSNKNR